MGDVALVPLIDTRKSGDRVRARDRSGGNAEEAKRSKRGGTITLLGAPEPQAQGICHITGVRSGVDVEYRFSEVTYSFSRDGEWVRVCDLNKPSTSEMI